MAQAAKGIWGTCKSGNSSGLASHSFPIITPNSPTQSASKIVPSAMTGANRFILGKKLKDKTQGKHSVMTPT